MYFNPRTREGCDLEAFYKKTIDYVISIHAPVKGATKDLTLRQKAIVISIHAPVKGATTGLCKEAISWQNFNPRTREGCDTVFHRPSGRNGWISIHAPVKGATHVADDLYSTIAISIHAPVKGATRVRAYEELARRIFQSTHP